MHLITNPPQTAVDFIKFMESIWDGENHHLYDDYHNATTTARCCGARRTGGSVMPDGANAAVYRFPNDPPYISVKIQITGGALEISYHKFSPKRRAAQ